MTLDDLAQGEHWMTPDERQNAAELVQSLRQIIAGRPIPENYPLVHCAREFILHHTLCQRLENGLIPDPAAVYPAIDPILAGYIARLHDRVRRILKEFQETAEKLDPTKPVRDTRRDGNHADRKASSDTVTPLAAEETPNVPIPPGIMCREFFEEFGVDDGDPELFSDEPSFFDLPIDVQFRLRPHLFHPHVRKRLGLPQTDPEPYPDPEAAFKEAMDAYLASGAEEELQALPAAQDASAPQPIPTPQPAPTPSTPSTPSPTSSLSIVNCPLSIPSPSTPSNSSHSSPPNANQFSQAQTPESDLPRPKTQDPKPSPWRSPIPPTPPPKVEYYRVKPTPFNQHIRYKYPDSS